MFEYYQNENTGRWHWRLVAHNHETICSTQSYGLGSEAAVYKGIESLMRYAAMAKMPLRSKTIPPQFKVFDSDKTDRWYWHLLADNNEIVCHGQPHGFENKRNARIGIKAVIKLVMEIAEEGITPHIKKVGA